MTANTSAFGIVGLGSMGTSHAELIEAAGGEVVAGTDVVTEKRDSFADEFGVPTFEDHEAMYDEISPDAVVITTPNRFHEPAATAALDRDLDVLCEKPLAHNLDAAQQIAEAANRRLLYGRVSQPIHVRRSPVQEPTGSGLIRRHRAGRCLRRERGVR